MDVTANDEVLVRRACNGDVTAFDHLLSQYYGICLRFAWRQLGNRADAEEAVQDAFVRAWRALHRCEDPARFRAWLMTIVVNRCRTYAAKHRRWMRLLERRFRAGPVDVAVSPRPAVDDADPRVSHALALLTPALREAVLLKHVEQLSYEEMADVTGVSVSALKMRVKRATDALARTLQEDDGR
jgi:RNA polymerase sigma-70 factor (ECF subfamily)